MFNIWKDATQCVNAFTPAMYLQKHSQGDKVPSLTALFLVRIWIKLDIHKLIPRALLSATTRRREQVANYVYSSLVRLQLGHPPESVRHHLPKRVERVSLDAPRPHHVKNLLEAPVAGC